MQSSLKVNQMIQHDTKPTLQDRSLVQIITSYRSASALYAFVKLDLPTFIHNNSSPTLKKAAFYSGVPIEKLSRLMDVIAMEQIVAIENSCLHLTTKGKQLATDKSLRDWILCELSPTYWNVWANLTDALQQNIDCAFDSTHNQSFFPYLKENENFHKLFQSVMTNYSIRAGAEVAKAINFEDDKKIVDVGGGHGHMLFSILKANQHLHGCVFELHENYKGFQIEKQKTGLLDQRATFQSGNFMHEAIPRCDTIIMKNIIHDWDDENAVHILSACRQSLKNNGRIILAEILKSEDPLDSLGKSLDLLMMLLFNGKERNYSQYQSLAEQSGLTISNIYPTRGPLSLIELRKA